MDFITDLPISNGFDSIFIVGDQGLSKGVILMPCNKTITAKETAKQYIDNVFIQYGLPDNDIQQRTSIHFKHLQWNHGRTWN